MSDIIGSAIRIQLEQTYYLAACNQELARRLGAAINYLLENGQAQAVGSMIQSIATEVQFQAARGVGWVLCDGRNVAGSAYQTLTGNASIPDARGVVMRGKNNGRADGFANPDGDLALGALQADQYKTHNHTATVTTNAGSSTGALDTGISFFPNRLRNIGLNVSAQIHLFQINAVLGITEVGLENRPRNITVNTFIRIN